MKVLIQSLNFLLRFPPCCDHTTTIIVTVYRPSTPAAHAGSLSPYVQLRFGGSVKRTHVLIDATATEKPVWNAIFTFAVPATAVNVLQLDVVDWGATGDPELVGTAEVSVDTRRDRVRVDEDLRPSTLSLVNGRGGARARSRGGRSKEVCVDEGGRRHGRHPGGLWKALPRA